VVGKRRLCLSKGYGEVPEVKELLRVQGGEQPAFLNMRNGGEGVYKFIMEGGASAS